MVIYKSDEISQINDLIPDTRMPVALCLDTSGSMEGAPIVELARGVDQFFHAMLEEKKTKNSAEVAVVTFDSNVTVLQNFREVADICATGVPEYNFEANGLTFMGEAINTVLDLLEDRKQSHKKMGNSYFQPWLVLMSDGAPNGSYEELVRAQNRIHDLVMKERLTVFAVGIGESADLVTMQSLSPGRPPLKLRGLNFREFFTWLGASVKMVSNSKPGEKVALPAGESISSWAIPWTSVQS